MELNRAHGFGYIIHNNCAIRVSIVHRRKGLISLLSRGIPYLKFDLCVIIEVDDLSEEGSSYRGFPMVIECFLEGFYQSAALGVIL